MTTPNQTTTTSTLQERILKYERFIGDTLQPDLQKELQKRDDVYAEIAEYLKLRNQIELIKSEAETSKEIKSMVDVGCDFFMQAKIKNVSTINVLIGADCHAELTLDEAIAFIDKKEKLLHKRADKITEKANTIKAHIKFVLAGIEELLSG
ncbi:hypothetical protein HDV05_006909 [Chytridiales sp. JEL 0842]|nr:hypothetical protein HDV05_006909 [Chytridiales sp. JEL 0842]